MTPPNILVVVLDTVRAGNVSCYGHARSRTRCLDKFASEGLLCRMAFAPAMWTIPSHASLLTGTYPVEHGALNLHRQLSDRFPTVAELLGAAGYETVAFSNNSFISLEDYGLARGFQLVEGFSYPRSKLEKVLARMWQAATGTKDCGAFHTNRFFSGYLRSRMRSGKPWFVLLNYMEAHAPYLHIPRKNLKGFLDGNERAFLKGIDQDRQRYLTGSSSLGEREFEILRRVYDAQIHYLDTMCGRLFETLQKRGLWDNTLVIVTSDHGDLIGEHGLVHHSYALYDELIRVPLLVKFPGTQMKGVASDALVTLLDVFPTMLASAGIEESAWGTHARGTALSAQSVLAERKQIFSECERPKNEFATTYPNFDFTRFDRHLLCIRTRQHKYIWASDGRHELYDMERDPRESRNLAGAQQTLEEDLHRRLFDWYSRLEKFPVDLGTPEVEMSDEVRKHLQALGYF